VALKFMIDRTASTRAKTHCHLAFLSRESYNMILDMHQKYLKQQEIQSFRKFSVFA